MKKLSLPTEFDLVSTCSWFLVYLSIGVFLYLKLNYKDLYNIPIFLHLLVLFGLTGSVLNGLILFLSNLSFWSSKPFEQSMEWTGNNPHKVFILTVVLLALASLYVYHAYPLCMDEAAPYFQARVFSQGKLVGNIPEPIFTRAVEPGNFFTGNAVDGVVAGYWPGFALFLTPFMLLGAPWLLNPLLSGISLLLIWRICRILFPSNLSVSGWAIWFALGASAFMVNAISFYSWPAHLCLNLLFIYLLLERSTTRAFGAGFVGSVALVLHNPVPHLLFAIPWIFHMFLKRQWRPLLALAAGYLPLCLFIGVGWVLFMHSLGGPTYSSVNIHTESGSILVSIGSMLTSGAFGIPDSRTVSGMALKLLSLINWAPPVLIVLAILGALRHWNNAYLRLMAFSALLTILGFTFHPDGMGHGWGFRHFHGAWGVVPILAAATIADTGERRVEACRFHSFIGASVFLSIIMAIPFYFYNVHSFISRHLKQLPELEPGKPQVAFIPEGYYTKDLLQYDPTGKSNILFLKSSDNLKEDVEFIRAVFPSAKPRNGNPNNMVWVLPENPHTLLANKIEKEDK